MYADGFSTLRHSAFQLKSMGGFRLLTASQRRERATMVAPLWIRMAAARPSAMRNLHNATPHAPLSRRAAAVVLAPDISLMSTCYRPVILPVILLRSRVSGSFEATGNKGLLAAISTQIAPCSDVFSCSG
jgi:hypothetical protein